MFLATTSLASTLSKFRHSQQQRKEAVRSTRLLLCFGLAVSLSASAQTGSQLPSSDAGSPLASASEAASSVTFAAPQNVVRWTGKLPEAAGRTVNLQFAIYANPSRGLALWSEAQPVRIDIDGRYSVLLGATTGEGLPQSLFTSNEQRWIEVRTFGINGNATSEDTAQPRTLLTAVPYAFRSTDSENLAGRAASDYVTREDLQSAVATGVQSVAASNPAVIRPDFTGTGTTGFLPIWTGTTALGNSVVEQTGTNVGIGTTTPSTTLDVNGSQTLRGSLVMPTSTVATAAAGVSSHTVELSASSFSSTTSAAVAQNFKLQALSTGNNTSSPSASLAVLFGSGAANPVATGLSFAANGKITFAPGQTFPGTGTITGITTTSPLTGSGTTGSVALGLNLSALETTLNPVYARLAAANNFTSSATFAGPITGNSGSTMYAIQGNTSSGYAIQGYATGTSGYGVNGYSTGNGGIGVAGNATGNANGAIYPIGVLGHVFSGTAIKGVLDEAGSGQSAVLGQTNGHSAIYTAFQGYGLDAGVWGDVADSSAATGMAIAGTADNSYAGVFENKSATWPTLYVYNGGTAGTGLPASAAVEKGATTKGSFTTMMVGGPGGTCGFGGSGDFSCTGQIKSLVATAGERTVETYSVQSAENWMEDFGSAELHSGSAVVTIDPTFAATVSGAADYRIFLTPNGDSKGLYVTNKTARSFEVRESGGGTASIGFDYRIVAKRRGFEKQRLTDVTEKFNAEMKAAAGSLKLTGNAQQNKQ